MSENLKGQPDKSLKLPAGLRNLIEAHAQRTEFPPEKIVADALRLYDRHSPLAQPPERPGEKEAVEIKFDTGVLDGVQAMVEETGVTRDELLNRSAELTSRLYSGLKPGEVLFIADTEGAQREFPLGSIPRRKAPDINEQEE